MTQRQIANWLIQKEKQLFYVKLGLIYFSPVFKLKILSIQPILPHETIMLSQVSDLALACKIQKWKLEYKIGWGIILRRLKHCESVLTPKYADSY